ncbi:MAG: hypothetical protein AAF430_25155 [Myxococcota bacterium]
MWPDVVGAAVGFAFVAVSVPLARRYRIEALLWSLSLVALPLFYMGFGALAADGRAIGLEFLAGLPYVALGLLCWRGGFPQVKVLAGVAWASHGLYDLGHDLFFVNPGVFAWYPAFCAAIDIAVGAFLVATRDRLRRRRPGRRARLRRSGPDGEVVRRPHPDSHRGRRVPRRTHPAERRKAVDPSALVRGARKIPPHSSPGRHSGGPGTLAQRAMGSRAPRRSRHEVPCMLRAGRPLLSIAVALCALLGPVVALAQNLPAAADVRLSLENLRVSDFRSTESAIRRNLAVSVADYFNDDVFSVRLSDVAESDPASAPMTVIDFTILKGGFVDWTTAELDLLAAADTAPNFYARTADNLDLEWTAAAVLSELQCTSSAVCRPDDLFRFIAGPDIDTARRLMMNIEVLDVRQVVPEPGVASLVWVGLLGLTWRQRRARVRA